VNGRTVRIRGISTTVNSSNEPLFILDGMPISQDSLSTIPVGEIEYSSVMKEATIYGARGANGAILINTRK
jgi:iron complex outermembrane receptor protein